MSNHDPICLNMPVDLEQAGEVVRKIVNKAHKDGTLSEMTPRAVRQKVEEDLGLDPGSLDEKAYKEKLKTIIQDAVDATTGSDDESEGDKQEGPSQSKKIPSPPKAKAKEKKPKKREMTGDADSDVSRKRKKDVTTVTKTKPPPSIKTNGNGGTPLEKKPDVVKLTSETAKAKYQSDSEMSVLIDEPPQKKRKKRLSDEAPKEKKPKGKVLDKEALSVADEKVKKLKSLVVACGVRKVWAKELKDCETTSQQISHLRRMLTDLGMKGRFSLEQAKTIRQQRELAQEIQDVREFAEKHAGEGRASRSALKGSKSKKDTQIDEEDEEDEEEEEEEEEEDDGSDEDHRETKRPRQTKASAHRSIMAFLGDQSDSD